MSRTGRPITKIEPGTRFGRLKVIKFIGMTGTLGSKSKIRRSRYKCLCDCGNYMETRSNLLIKGNTNSCGCLSKEITSKNKFKGNGISAFNSLISRYKRSAEYRNLEFNLTNDQLMILFKQNCSECGVEPRQIIKSMHSNTEESIRNCFIYNGIDRINNLEGYILKNVQPCCKICNRAKSSLTIDEFNEWKERIRNFNK